MYLRSQFSIIKGFSVCNLRHTRMVDNQHSAGDNRARIDFLTDGALTAKDVAVHAVHIPDGKMDLSQSMDCMIEC